MTQHTIKREKIAPSDKTVGAQPAASGQPSTLRDCASYTASLMLCPGTQMPDIDDKDFRTNKPTGFLDLPLEIRVIIYKFAMSTNDNVYEIAKSLWPAGTAKEHAHLVTNIEPNHLALFGVTHGIRTEIKAYLPNKDFRFPGTCSLERLLLGEGGTRHSATKLNLLDKTSKVQVALGSEERPERVHVHWDALGWMVYALPKPLALEFIPTESSDESMKAVCRKVARKWQSKEYSLEYKQAQAEGR